MLYTRWASFFQILTFLLTRVLREENLFTKKVPSSANSALSTALLHTHISIHPMGVTRLLLLGPFYYIALFWGL